MSFWTDDSPSIYLFYTFLFCIWDNIANLAPCRKKPRLYCIPKYTTIIMSLSNIKSIHNYALKQLHNVTNSCVMQIDVASYCKRLFSEVLLGLIIETLSVHITNKQHRRGLKVKVWYKQDKWWSADTETRNERTRSRRFKKKDGWKGWTYSKKADNYDLSSFWLLILLELCHCSMTS